MINSTGWINICSQEVRKIHKKHAIEPHQILLWVLTRFLEGVSDKVKTANKLTLLKQKKCGFLKDIFDLLDQKYSNSVNEVFGSFVIPETHELENLYQKVLKGSYKGQTGSFYTGKEMAAFMVRQSLRDLLAHSEAGHTVTDRLKYLKSIRIIDISCGGGMFLRESLKQLFALQTAMAIELEWRFDDNEWIGHILQNQLTGVDQEVEAAVLAEILLRHEMPSAIQESIEVPICCEDSLLWHPPQDGKYDLVIGNPPYIGEKGNQTIFKTIKDTDFGKQYYERSMDYFYFFLYRGSELLKDKGRLCYITTAYFATADGGKKLRKYLANHLQFHWIIQLGNKKVFQQAKGQHNLIYSLTKKDNDLTKPVTLLFVDAYEGKTKELFDALKREGIHRKISGVRTTTYESSSAIFDERGQLLLKQPTITKPALEKLITQSTYQLKDVCTVNQGLVSGADKVTEKHRKVHSDWKENRGIFVLTIEEIDALRFSEEEKTFLKPFHKNSDILPFHARKREDQWILYVTDQNMPDIRDYPRIREHLEKFRPVLQKRREVQMDIRKWYALHWPRRASLFEKPKIVVPQRGAYNIFAWVPEAWYASADVYYIQMKPEAWFSPLYLLGWLNSSLCYAYLSFYGKTKGEDLELYATPLKSIPVPMPTSFQQEESVMKLVETLMNENEMKDSIRERCWNHLDCLFLEGHGINGETAEMINSKAETLRKNIRRRNW